MNREIKLNEVRGLGKTVAVKPIQPSKKKRYAGHRQFRTDRYGRINSGNVREYVEFCKGVKKTARDAVIMFLITMGIAFVMLVLMILIYGVKQ